MSAMMFIVAALPSALYCCYRRWSIVLAFEGSRHTLRTRDQNPYRILRARWGATDAEIRHAYRKRARRLHPDKAGRLGAHARGRAERRMAAANRAYEALRDPDTKARVDETLRARRAGRTLLAVLGASVLVVLLAVVVLRMPRAAGGADLGALIEATKARPGDLAAWNRRWRAEAAAGRTAQAAASLARAVSLDPANVDLHEAHGAMAARAGDHATALAEATWLRAHGYHGRADDLTQEGAAR